MFCAEFEMNYKDIGVIIIKKVLCKRLRKSTYFDIEKCENIYMELLRTHL